MGQREGVREMREIDRERGKVYVGMWNLYLMRPLYVVDLSPSVSLIPLIGSPEGPL